MAEWLKILVSTVTGFGLGIVADPIKGSLQWKINVARMERAILLDFVMIRAQLETVKADLVPEEKFWQALNVPAFEYYWNKNRELFYGSLDLQMLTWQCRIVEYTRTSVLQGTVGREEGKAAILKAFEEVQRKLVTKGRLRARLRGLLLRMFC